MKIYVVTGGYDYEDSFVLGVTLSLKKAEEIEIEEAADEFGVPLDWTNIEEWEVEE